MARPPRIPNWLPWGQESVYFITFCIEKRRHVLANHRSWEICLDVLARLDRWTTLAAIAMPDHLHILTAPLDREASVSAYSKWFKRWFDETYCRPFVSDLAAHPKLGMAGRLFRQITSFG
jgi:REP element-mobilizing transposase RayT